MRSFTLISAFLLCSLSWISVSASESHTVDVQSGGDVTLMCANISKTPAQTEWFRLINGTKPSCVSAMYGSDVKASFCDGFQNRFEMSANISTVFLKIKTVDLSDSGLYFCGIYMGKHTVITNATYLKVQEESDGMTDVMSVILGALTVSLTIVVIVLAVKIRKLQTAVIEEQQPERNKDLGSDELNYAALNFQAQPKRSRRPAPVRELDPHVVYVATR
ncbi:T-cell immunoreceptor with Ig and ITIM domains-like isoform X3 [Etheostoma spectabile]|uniref:T-cell immunoreceptor with Ig and ITIM domains-like isoform X3 n=1 Tax=Etheostoma spectabile TaxID=54343 RepID=UPI0013AFA2FF|nr:T-cell immunoreceptor with Ig and ITIM domains-like isoform X3 [Etheostoma spectabile]